MTASTYSRAPVKVSVSKKSQANRAPAWERRKSAQVAEARSGAGSNPAPRPHPVSPIRSIPMDEEDPR